LGGRLSNAFNVHSGQLFNVHAEVGYANEDGSLIGK
jgi:hypothetical protein